MRPDSAIGADDSIRSVPGHDRRAAPYLLLSPPALRLTTGRTVYHFHTRTKTGRAPELQGAAPEVWVELSPHDAGPLGVTDGDVVEIRSRRGAIRAPTRLTDVRQGVVFVPLHYGYWDDGGSGPSSPEAARAANELTLTSWDPVSKQPMFKVAAVSVIRISDEDAR